VADVDAVVVGAGAVGLAIGRALALAGQSVIVLEQHRGIGEEISSRNSEVIHAGLYYPPGSLKARLCAPAAHALYSYCGARGIEAQRLGKLVVAPHASDLPALEALAARARENGVDGIRIIDGPAIRALEPQVQAEAAIVSPHSGIFDSHSYMLALLGEIEDGGGALAREAPFEGAAQLADGSWQVRAGGAEPVAVTAARLILSPGLHASAVAARVEGLDPATIPVTRYARGNYFRYVGKAPFGRLIYPMPGAGGLGIHVTPDLSGHAKFGPDVQPVDTLDYRVDESRRTVFAESIRAYWPQLDETLLVPDYAGIRPKIGNALKGFEDFRIDGLAQHGLAGLHCLYGIDSPGLTCSLLLGEHVARLALASGA
jgi:L-2-hydroxyglutarate oxidase LhgO